MKTITSLSNKDQEFLNQALKELIDSTNSLERSITKRNDLDYAKIKALEAKNKLAFMLEIMG